MSINFICTCNSQLGYGIASLNILKAAHELGYKWSLFPISFAELDISFKECIEQAKFLAQKPDYKAPSVRLYHQFELSQHVGKGLHIGYPIFELDKFTDIEIHHLSNQDALFVCSNWAKNIIENNNIKIPCFVVPLGVDRKVFHEGVQPILQFEYPNNTRFLSLGKWEIRKGHDIIAKAFTKAFDKSDNAHLIMHSFNPVHPEAQKVHKEWSTYYKNLIGEQVTILDGRFNLPSDIAGLIASCDCGVFPTRAEGWGLPLLEMLSCGKHIITTNYSGHTEFVNKDNSMLLSDSNTVPAFDAPWFFGQGNWMNITNKHVDELAEYMRLIHKQKQEGSLSTNHSGIETARKFSWENSVQCLMSAINKLEN